MFDLLMRFPTQMDNDGQDVNGSLDPEDWENFRSEAHRLLDACIDRLANAKNLPWIPVDDSLTANISLGDCEAGLGVERTVDDLIQRIMPFSTGNTHPRFFGWVHGTGLASGLLAEIAAATMNSNCGGRDHGAIYVEREVIRWCARIFGLPESAGGILVAGTSQATVLALACARQKALGAQSRSHGISGAPRLIAYAARGSHSAIAKACALLGLGTDSLRTVECDESGSIEMDRLRNAIALDRAGGAVPFCVVGTAGSVGAGSFDDLRELTKLCRSENIWFHVDGAFGVWLGLAESPWSEKTLGIEGADSIAFDFHKLMFVQYECGAIVVRDDVALRDAFSSRPSYLAANGDALSGGDPWFCEYGIDLSRSFKALKVWTALRTHGIRDFRRAISRCCELTKAMEEMVKRSDELRIVSPAISCICCFTAAPVGLLPRKESEFNVEIARQLQLSGEAVFSTTLVDGRIVIRAAIANHRTSLKDVEIAIGAAKKLSRLLAGELTA